MNSLDPRPDPRRWWGLGALALALLALGFDLTILNVALTTLSDDLDASTSELQWIVDSYILVFAAILLPAGLLGDRFGRKWLLLAGLALFGVGSLAGALAGDAAQVIAARAVMGVGAAVVMPLSMSILPAIFPPHERTRAIAVWSASMALGLPIGPVLGGWLLDHYWWGSIFLINVPVVVVGLVAVALLLPESRARTAPGIDWTGTLLSMAGLVALVYGIIEAPLRGWTDPLALGAMGGGVLLLAGFVLWERRIAQPMMDVALFRDRPFLWGALVATLCSALMAGALFVLPQYFQSVQRADALGAGLRLIPMMLGLLVAGLATDRLAGRIGHRPIIVAGLVVLAAGLGWGALTDVGDSYGSTAGWLTVTGLGVGLALIPAMDMVLARLPEGSTGRGSGLVQAFRQTGSAIGIAALGSLLSSIYRDRLVVGGLPGDAAGAARDSVAGAVRIGERLGDGGLLRSARDSYVQGMDMVLGVCAAAALAMAALALVFLPRRAVQDGPKDAAEPADGGESEHEHAST